MSGSHLVLLGGSPKVETPVDPYFYSVTSLLHGDGTNGAQNNTFLDGSTNNFTITRNGNTTQGSFSPFSQTGWGNYFDGSSYISAADNAALDLGTGDFTIEGWVYIGDGIADNAGIVSKRSASTFNTGDYRISYRTGTSKITFADDTVNERSTPAVQKNAWTHFAIVRSSGTLSAYANGFRGDTAADSVNLTNAEIQTIGVNASIFFTGYISNVRIVKGTAVYSGSTYTVPTAPLTAISGTSLLTCQSNRFVDNSSNAFSISTYGTPSVQPFSPFNPTTAYSTSTVGGSGYFDGSGDYLTVADNAALDMGSSNFTIEGWYFPLGNASVSTAIFSKRANSGTVGGVLLYYGGGGLTPSLLVDIGGSWAINTASSVAFVSNQWNHFAVVRNGSAFNLYINGVSGVSASNAGAIPDNSSGFAIGAMGADGSGPISVCYMSDFRIVKGTAVYTSAFTPPTAPLTAIANTSLLCNFTNAGIFDNAADADYETVGNAQISTSVKKYGTGSMAFDGTGDYLTAPSNRNFAFGTGDFTIEYWIYTNSSADDGIFQLSTTAGGFATSYTNGMMMAVVSGVLYYALGGSSASTGFTINNSTWYHIAMCRTSGVLKIFVNGTQVVSAANTTDVTATNLVIGGYYSTSYTLVGYIDDFRISKGIGRYAYNFTPPTAEFPNIGGTVTLTADPYYEYITLLLPGNGTNGAQNNTFLDSSTNNFTITRNGNTTQGTFSPFSQTGWGNYFDGSGDRLSLSGNSAFDISSGDFTVEGWIYPQSNAAAQGLFVLFTATNGNYAGMTLYVQRNTDSTITVYGASPSVGGSSPAVLITTTATAPQNTWTHIAVTRSSSTFTCWINGVSAGTATFAGTLYWSPPNLYVGSGNDSSPSYFTGYISNVRIVKGTAVYTTAFTPPTSALTAISGTGFLSCQSNRFVDNSTNNFAITRSGDVSVQAFSPFNPTAAWSAATYGGSGYFDGSGDYLNTSSTQVVPSGSFTVEAWAYPTSSANSTVVAQGTTGNAARFSIGIESSLWWTQIGGVTINAGTPVLNAWTHLAATFNGSTLTLYVNGVSVGTASTSTNAQNTTLRIGSLGPADWSTYYWTGYIGQIRVSNTVRSISVPTAPYTSDANTAFLGNFTNAGIYDATSKNDLETVGNAQISTTQSKFGGSSMYFDGSGDQLNGYGVTTNLNLLSGSDFTIEFWMRPDTIAPAASGYSCILGMQYYAGSVGYGVFQVNATISAFFNGSTTQVTTGNVLAAGTWAHVAITRYNGTVRIFVNGVLSCTPTSASNSNTTSSYPLTVGGVTSTTGWNADYPYAGYLQDVRITKGIARYTSNFTPPTTAFLTL